MLNILEILKDLKSLEMLDIHNKLLNEEVANSWEATQLPDYYYDVLLYMSYITGEEYLKLYSDKYE